jgi:hypothetical protein
VTDQVKTNKIVMYVVTIFSKYNFHFSILPLHKLTNWLFTCIFYLFDPKTVTVKFLLLCVRNRADSKICKMEKIVGIKNSFDTAFIQFVLALKHSFYKLGLMK